MAFIPNGALKDGTLLSGPYYEQPAEGRFSEVVIDGQKHFVRHCGLQELTPDQQEETQQWAEGQLRQRAEASRPE